MPGYTKEQGDEEKFFRLAETSARQALVLDANIGEAHAVLAQMNADRGDFLDAESGFFFAISLEPNQPMIDLMREVKGSGLTMALLTNNVREWEPLWRSMLPVDEIFETVVDSAFVGLRKPDPRIYEIVLERLELPAEACAFVDDLERNVAAARELGFHGVEFRDTAQVIAELDALLERST